MSAPRIGVVIVTMGNRPRELAALLDSVDRQCLPAQRVVLVGSACPLTDVDRPGLQKLPLADNPGCPGARNVGLRALLDAGDVDVVVELDDDGLLIADDVFRRVAERYAAEPQLGIVAFRIADEHGETQRRHVPRLRASDPMRAGLVTAFLGGGHALSVPMLRRTGLWAGEFRFGHEETDLAWRALDDGWTIQYDPQVVLQHPKTSPARHAVYFRYTARNRVWLAKRRLPAPLVPLYLATWLLLTLVRTRSLPGLASWFAGFAEGLRTSCPPRRPMRWRTVWHLTRLGRPPLI
ncbi:glycosyl transferase [Kitasatospora griseola]|uniref:Glycosyl transferase n=1 Tax=Kitasatospora griseola TaxID=2064 RepID=A0A0D0Q255_KITGR|nr:glycosyltransferase family 2 protein [Kitasatospora griseola]KIQ65053.1 glycosyl transferase [Kitasatospora griseola]